MIEKVIEFAKAGGFAGVYIPADEVIHSNRSMIQKAIAERGYGAIDIPTVRWDNTLRIEQQHLVIGAYPFSRVYVVWERVAQKSPSKSRSANG
jgi:hypothetical protein